MAQNTLIQGLYQQFGADLRVITVAANFDDPSVLNRVTRQRNIRLGCGAEAVAVGNMNYGKLIYYLSIIVTYTRALLRIVRERKDRRLLVITSGPYVFTALPVWIAGMSGRICWVPFLIGSVELPDYRGPLSLISRLSKVMITKASGSITYVERSSVDYTDKPYVTILFSLDESVVATSDRYFQEGRQQKPFTIMYSGALTKIKGADILLDVIHQAGDSYHWVICGGGPYENEFRRLSDELDCVEYLGVLPHPEVIRLQCQADVLIALQSQDNEVYRYYARYAATSKLIEYLVSGTPVITPDVEAINSVLRPYLNFLDSQAPQAIVEAIDRIRDNYQVYREKSVSARESVKQIANAEYQNQRVLEFLDEVYSGWVARKGHGPS